MKLTRFAFVSVALALLSACGPKEPASQAPAAGAARQTPATSSASPAAVVADAAAISGKITFDGQPPVMPVIQMAADPSCPHGEPVRSEEVVVGSDGSLANVLVYIKDYKGQTPAVPSTSVVVSQKGCRYVPHVAGVMVGQTVEIRNDDSTLHNVHAMASVNEAFNEGQPFEGMVTKKVFDKPEMPIKLKCDVHGWMSAYLAVLPNPYFAVSGIDGKFSIGNVPPGTYTIEAWHEKYGTKTMQVTVGAKETKDASFKFAPKAG